MQGVQINKPEILNLDASKSSLKQEEFFYALNHDSITMPGKSIPLAANYLGCDIEMPEGDNYVLGSYYSKLTNETYVFVGNSNNSHFIYRINGDGTCQIVTHGNCLQSVLGTVSQGVFAPQYDLNLQCRVQLRVEKICHNRHGKELIFTNGLGNIGCIDVEASIATDSFSTEFFDRCAVGCETVELCVPKTCGCITGEFLPLDDSEKGLTNKMVDTGFKWIYQQVYYDLRASEWSEPSSLYYQDSKGCFSNTDGFPRCIELTIPLGNPLVDKIKVAYSTDGGANWLLSDTVEKYESYSSSKQYWYQRSINTDLELTEDMCSFKYRFCNDKQCQAIDPTDISRVYNPAPRQPQGFINVKDLYGFFNFTQGTCPLDRSEVDKFQVALDCTSVDDCSTEYVTVKVRAVVQNFFYNTNEPVKRAGGTLGNYVDDVTDPASFGMFSEGNYHNTFGGKKRNFTAYIEGTNYFSEMKQWKANEGFINKTQIGVFGGVNNTFSLFFERDWYFYQEATFTVRKGTKGFIRLISHESSSNNANTSTYVRGVLGDIANYNKAIDVTSIPFTEWANEIYFDASAGDVSLTQTFVIEDLVKNSDLGSHSSAAYFGYLKLEDGTPIEYAELWRDPDRWMVTDFNGFFFRAFDSLDDPYFDVRVELDCGSDFNTIKSQTLSGSYGGANQTDIIILDSESAAYKNVFLTNVDIKATDCDGVALAGIKIALSDSKSRTTGADGVAHFEIRNKSERDRTIRAIVMDNNGCFLLNCADECNASVPSVELDTGECYSATPTLPLTVLHINTSNLSLANRGLKKGGRYGYSIIAEGACGRISAAYELKDGYINIPKLQDNSKTEYCSFTYNANDILLPEWVDCLKIARTQNLNPFELQWLVDKIERTSDGKIKLTIQSLNDYNAAYFFKTNTVYKYLKGDRVEFIKNGDGTIFTTAVYGLLNYATLSPFKDSDLSGEQSDADYFNQLLIEDNNKLDGLVKGAIIEIQRAKECTTEPTYYSICVSLNVEEGRVVNQTGSFNTFDTYIVNRTIGEFPSQNFEHHSPSDFWGERLTDAGKAYFINKYENERRFGRHLILNAADEFNRFDSTLIKVFDAPEQGDITAMYISDGKIILAIGEHDNFLSQVSDTLVRIGQDGLARAAQPDQIISDGEPKLSGQFGCKYEDVGSVYFADGYAKFIDTNKSADVIHNYNIAKDVSEGRTKSYFKKRCTQIKLLNAEAGTNYIEHYKFITGINKVTNAIYTTIKKLTQSGINNSQAPYVNLNETIIYHAQKESYFGFASFTPESYSVLNLNDDSGCNFITFLKGSPYIHPVVATDYLEFYNETVDWVVCISMNKYAEKIKRGLAIEVQDATALWFVSKVETEVVNWLSEIPVIKAKRVEDKINMSFLANKNGRGGLYGDDKPRGFSTQITLIRNNTLNLAYGTIDDSKRKIYSELGFILFKFLFSEMSGYSNVNT